MSEFQFVCTLCGETLLVDSSCAGMQVQCPGCQNSIIVPEPEASPPLTYPRKESRMKEYKVMTQKDKWFAGKFDPEKLEQAINSYAAQGWEVVSVATATIPSVLGGSREEMIVVMEREK